MKSWPVQDAAARFGELLETCLKAGPQIVTMRGADAAVLVPVSEWERLQHAATPTLKQLLLSNHARVDFALPERAGRRRRRASVVS